MKKSSFIKMIMYFVTVAFFTFIDQWTKYIAVKNLKGAKPFVIIDGVLEFYYLQNDGSAWGILSGKQGLFIAITCVVFLLLLYVAIMTPYVKHYAPIHIVNLLLMSGAAGNFIDRVQNGYVRDFIYFKLINFPVFNIADAYITISMLIFIIVFLFVYKDNEFQYLIPGKYSKRNKTNDN